MRTLFTIFLVLVNISLLAQDSFVLVKEKKAEKLEAAVNEITAKGYVVQGAIASKDGLGVLLHKESGKREYKIIDVQKLADLKSRLAANGSGEFRLLPNTIVTRGKSFGARQYTVLLENNGDGKKYEYLVLISQMDNGMVRTLEKAEKAGYRVLSVLPDKDQQVAIIVEKSE